VVLNVEYLNYYRNCSKYSQTPTGSLQLELVLSSFFEKDSLLSADAQTASLNISLFVMPYLFEIT